MNASAQQPENGESRTGYPGIIDTLGNAFALLNRRPYLVWLPITFDLILWTGPRLSVSDPLAWLGTMTTGAPGWLAELIDQARSRVADTELLGISGWLMPTLLDERGDLTSPDLSLGSEIQIPESFGAVLALVALALTLGIGATYLTMVGRLVNDRPAWGIAFARDCIGNAWRLSIAGVNVLGLLAFLFVPFGFLGVGLHLVGVDPAVLLIMVAFAFAMWASVFFFFAAHSLALGETRPSLALRASYSVVRRNLWSVFGLLLVVLLIRFGTPIALEIFTETPWSVPFAIVVNAYVVTGLVAATMIYFRDRSAESSLSPSASNAVGASG